MSKRITIDPVTRIEGHLRIDCEVGVKAPGEPQVDAEGNPVPVAPTSEITKAWSSGTMWRGIETILKGRDPRDAWLFTQRICGVCTTVHAIASVRSVEDALMDAGELENGIPLNAQYIRNLMIIGHGLADHIVHFYQLSALDWVDVLSAAEGDPAEAAALAQKLSDWPGNSKQHMQATLDKIKSIAASKQLGIFTHGYWGHKAMKLPPHVNLMAVNHYLQALEYQRKAHQLVAILGSKTPNVQNLAVGGVANAINLDNPAAFNMAKLYKIKELIDEVKAFVQQVYFPDVCAIGGLYPEWLSYGAGVTNYMAVPDLPLDSKGTKFDVPGGVIMGADLSTYKPISTFGDKYFENGVTESSACAYYADDGTPLHPYEGQTEPKYSEWDADGKYSWSKAPRFEGNVMQVGPLAQVLMGLATKDKLITEWSLKCLDLAGSVAGVKLTPAVLHSTLGRHAARAIRSAVLADLAVKHWGLLVDNIKGGDTSIFAPFEFPKGEIKGFGFHEAPRGALSHWTVIKDGKIDNYQCVVPSTWNLGPRDEKGQESAVEACLAGNPMADPEKPLEALRTVHSFDPCLACAIHTVDMKGEEISKVRVS